MDTLAFGYVLPTTGRTPDLHRLETCAAGRTERGELRQFCRSSPLKGKAIKLVVDQLILIVPAVQLTDLCANCL